MARGRGTTTPRKIAARNLVFAGRVELRHRGCEQVLLTLGRLGLLAAAAAPALCSRMVEGDALYRAMLALVWIRGAPASYDAGLAHIGLSTVSRFLPMMRNSRP